MMQIKLEIHEATVYRWAGVFEGIVSLFLVSHFNWFAALAIFIVIRFLDTLLLEMLMNKLAAMAAASRQ